MLLRDALTFAVEQLTAAHTPSPRMNAEVLLMFALDCDRSHLYAYPERRLTSEEQGRYEHAIAERARGVPAQYITGNQEFWGLGFLVSSAVLIPRPETEHLIETVLELTAGKGNWRMVDVGTGSGAIAIALAHELPNASLDATDISPAALAVAEMNAARLEVSSRIQFHQADLLDGLFHAHLDFVVSNPPYVGESEEDAVQLEVRKFEPRNAVFAGSVGTEIIARLIPQAHAALRPGGWLVMEISGTIAPAVRELLAEWTEVEITPDLQGIPRIVRARKH